MKTDKKIELTVIVSGKSVQVEANENSPLKSIIGKALEETGNTGQKKENWEFKNETGEILDADKKISELGLSDGVKLYLNPKAGVGG